MDTKASISAVKQVSAQANLIPSPGGASAMAMVEHKLTYNGTAIKLGDATQTFAQVKSACDDATKFVFLVYENRLYIPQYVYNDRINFTCTYPTETSGVMTRRIAMMSSGAITVNNTGLQTAIADLAAIRRGAELGATALQEHQDISGKENTSNKVTSISSASNNTQYPTAKAVYDFITSLDGNGVAY